MGKLKEMVVEETSMENQFKYNTRRIQLAGLGLFAKIQKAGGQEKDESIIGKLNVLGNGAVNLVREETLRIFDELVEAGEEFKAKAEVKSSKPKNSGKDLAAKKAALKQPKKAEVKPIKVKATEAPNKAKRQTKSVEIDMDLKKAFTDAQAKAKSASDVPQEKALALLALALQAEEGDVKGRRPAKAKVEACEIFDARREIKGMKQEEAMSRYIEAVKNIA